jgi:hypothetical protein
MEPAEVSRALTATISHAPELGLSVEDAIVLQNANRLAVRLVPCDVLLASAPWFGGTMNLQRSRSRWQGGLRKPAARSPFSSLAWSLSSMYVMASPSRTWKYYEPMPAADTTSVEYAQALELLHAGMRQIDAPAPHFTDRFDEAESIVRERSQSPELVDTDRELLTKFIARPSAGRRRPWRGRAAVVRRIARSNLLRTTSGIRLIDTKTCCYGPVEFEIAHAPDEVGDHYTIADPLLLLGRRGIRFSASADADLGLRRLGHSVRSRMADGEREVEMLCFRADGPPSRSCRECVTARSRWLHARIQPIQASLR